jgi:hypothetical protein
MPWWPGSTPTLPSSRPVCPLSERRRDGPGGMTFFILYQEIDHEQYCK